MRLHLRGAGLARVTLACLWSAFGSDGLAQNRELNRAGSTVGAPGDARGGRRFAADKRDAFACRGGARTDRPVDPHGIRTELLGNRARPCFPA